MIHRQLFPPHPFPNILRTSFNIQAVTHGGMRHRLMYFQRIRRTPPRLALPAPLRSAAAVVSASASAAADENYQDNYPQAVVSSKASVHVKAPPKLFSMYIMTKPRFGENFSKNYLHHGQTVVLC